MLMYSATFDSTLGYPGEGPPGARRPPPPMDTSRAVSAERSRSTSPAIGLSARPQRARLPNSRLSDPGGAPIGIRPPRAASPALSMDSDSASVSSFDYDVEILPEALVSHGARVAFISKFMECRRLSKFWRKKSYTQSKDSGEFAAGRGSRGFRPTTVQDTIDNRTRASAVEINDLIAKHPESEHADIVARVIDELSMPAREALRKTSPMEIEWYLAIRWAFTHMKEHWWTPYNWLELRLKKFISISAFTFAHRVFSKTENDEGKWEPATLLPMPTPHHRAEAFGIFGPMRVPSIVRTPAEMSRVQDVILKDHQVTNSADGLGASFDPLKCSADCLKHARGQKNLREAASMERKYTRLQILCDALGFYRGGRMATRFGIRCMDLARLLNSPYFFHNISIYLNGDKHKELSKYLGAVLGVFNGFRRTTPAKDASGKPVQDEKGQPEFDTELVMSVEGEACLLCDGGDAAGGNAMAALEPPPSREGCCYYCELRGEHWYDRAKCDGAKRRNFMRSTLLSHRVPPGVTCPMLCPGCGYEVSAAQEKRDLDEYENMSPNKKSAADLDHRRAHAGEQYLSMKLIHSDHCYRALSLLHLMLNTVSSTLTVCVSAGATNADRVAVNETLAENNHQWRLKEKKTVFEKKPAGNECRHFLWRPGNVLLKVLRTRYHVTTSTPATAELEAAVSGVQLDGAHHGTDANQRMDAPVRPRPEPAKAPKVIKRARVDILSALGAPKNVPKRPPPPPPPTRPSLLLVLPLLLPLKAKAVLQLLLIAPLRRRKKLSIWRSAIWMG